MVEDLTEGPVPRDSLSWTSGNWLEEVRACLSRQCLKGSIHLPSPSPSPSPHPGCHCMWPEPGPRGRPWLGVQGPGPASSPLQVYVQDLLRQKLADEVLRVLLEAPGHIYVCGGVGMARDVAHTLKQLVAAKLGLSEEQVEDYFFRLKVWWLACNTRAVRARDSWA